MKKGLLIALMLCICGFVNAQRVFTLVYAISDDGFVNIRATPFGKRQGGGASVWYAPRLGQRRKDWSSGRLD